MEIIFTHHAKYRIMERNISVLEVRKVIKSPDSQKMDKYGMLFLRKKIGGKILGVVCRIQTNKQIVITAYYEN